MEKTTVYLPEEIRWMLRYVAKRTGQSQADVIREALQLFLQQQERPPLHSLGVIESSDIRAADDEEWLKEHWRPD